MILPNGVTGFFDSVDTSQTKVDGKQFKQICFTINSTELKEIVYWKPQTVGEIIFNYWD